MSLCFGWIVCTDTQRQLPPALHWLGGEGRGERHGGWGERERRGEASGGGTCTFESTIGTILITVPNTQQAPNKNEFNKLNE